MTVGLNPVRPSFDIGRVLGNTFRAIGQNGGVFFGLSALLQGLPLAIVGVLQYVLLGPEGAPGGFDPSTFGRSLLITFGSAFVQFVFLGLLQASLSHGVFNYLTGRRATFGDCLRTGLLFMLPSILIGIITGIGVFVGIIFLIVPGIILALGWCVSVPSAVVERKQVFDAISRSWRLTDGYKLQVFLIALVYFAGTWIVSLIMGAVFGVVIAINASMLMIVTGVILTPLISTITSVFAATGAAAIYYELRLTKENVGADQMAEVFA